MNPNQIRSNTYPYRLEILNKFGNKCIDCDSIEKLEVHHPHYKYLKIDELILLCKKCHSKLHKRLPKLSKEIIYINFFVDEELHHKFKVACVKRKVDIKDRLNELIEQDVNKFEKKEGVDSETKKV